jgi:hypothetical protein
LAALLAAYPLLGKAFSLVLAVLILVIVIGTLTYLAIHFVKKFDEEINPPPPAPQTNSVSVNIEKIWWTYLNPTNPILPPFDWNRAESNCLVESPMLGNFPALTNPGSGHVLQYGYASLPSNSFVLWMRMDAGIAPNLTPLETNGLVQTLLDDGANFDGIVAVLNNFYPITVQSNPSNKVSLFYSPLVHYTAINGITNMVALNFVIDRGDTLQSMMPFYTNRGCYLDAVNMLIDSNAFPNCGFYRVRLQEGIPDTQSQTNSTYWGN